MVNVNLTLVQQTQCFENLARVEMYSGCEMAWPTLVFVPVVQGDMMTRVVAAMLRITVTWYYGGSFKRISM